MSYVLLAQSDYSPADAISDFLVMVLIVIAVAALAAFWWLARLPRQEAPGEFFCHLCGYSTNRPELHRHGRSEDETTAEDG